MNIEVKEEVATLGVVIETDILDDAEARPSRKEVFDILAGEIRSEHRERYHRLSKAREDLRIKAFRKFYWKIGIDPTKTRPSSEALVTRLFKKGLPRINNMVDAGNLASVRDLIPIGLYDMEHLAGEPVLRISEPGELFRGIGGKDEEMDGNIPVLADEKGIIHLYPHRDSMRTRITENTTEVLMVACGVRGIRPRDLKSALDGVFYYYDQLRS